MFRKLGILLLVVAPSTVSAIGVDDFSIIKRGDVNNDNAVNVTDIVFAYAYLYQGGPAPPCMNQADVNNDGAVNVSDPVYLSNWLYEGGSAPPSPGPFNTTCAQDDAPFPGCNSPCS